MSNEEVLISFIKRVFCRSGENKVEFTDLVKELEKSMGKALNMFAVRKAVSTLIRSGCIEKIADYNRARYYLIISSQCCPK